MLLNAAVVLSLPSPGFYYLLHGHRRAERCVWQASDRIEFDRVKDMVTALYEHGDPTPDQIDGPYYALDALYNPSISKEEALARIQPYYAEVVRTLQNVNYLRTSSSGGADSVELSSPAGTAEEEHGYRTFVIARGGAFVPTLETLVAFQNASNNKLVAGEDRHPIKDGWNAGEKIYLAKDDTEVDLQGNWFRTHPALVAMVRQGNAKAASEKIKLKAVMVPNEYDVYVDKERQGEVVRQVAKTWS